MRNRTKIILTEDDEQLYSSSIGKIIKIGDVLCSTCRLIPYRGEASTDNINDLSHSSTENKCVSDSCSEYECNIPQKTDLSVDLCLNRVASTHRHCSICSNKSDLITIPLEARIHAFVKVRIYIPLGNRACNKHFFGKFFYEEDIRQLRIYSNTSLVPQKEISIFLNALADTSVSLFKQIDNLSISSEQIKILTGFNLEVIAEISKMLRSMKNSNNRNIFQALVIFLFKLKTGNSNQVIAGVFNISKRQVSHYYKQILIGFEKDILDQNFGLESFTRTQLISETSYNAQKILGLTNEQLALICDGTYIRHEKSTNNEYQRKSFSGQKRVPLCKPFTICTTNGFIVDFLGPYLATQNDATIMKIILKNAHGIRTFLQPDDILLVDRGFRDALTDIKSAGYVPLMPCCRGRRKQLTTEEANESRRITKLRWVIEAVHGNIAQRYRLLHNTLNNKLLPKVRTLCKIVGFLHNKYGKRLSSDGDLADEVINYMNERTIPNTLHDEVIENRWTRRATTLQLLQPDQLLDFPHLNERELKILFTGSYQLSQAISYLAEMLSDQNQPKLYYVKEHRNIIRIDVQSRHINRKKYNVYIEYTPLGTNYRSILRYCCSCPNGLRTVGCCSHIAAIIYYMSFARYLSRIIRPSEILSKIFIIEETSVAINHDSDDD
ncbi:uncharacterized protein LOC113367370 [Ctenocephalides felis]|uniref:uncharacterized protein LOC113367370 n=1 Tax=Ctenocephalides felis TaxID=7515 RepID=UPI000E6E3193|nr:uncharacterized protein LOC113367370 [Ctenocephalides felis]